MKGDFTRFTFRPEKRYSNVLMQQGRMQLDADWNEQMSILNYLNQTQAKDMIGGSGTSRTVGGFQVSATPDGSDLVISAGNYYIGGILCELQPGSTITAEYDVPTPPPSAEGPIRLKVRVPVFTVDGLKYATNQWLELGGELTKIQNPKDRWFRIENTDATNQTLDLLYPTQDAEKLKKLADLFQGKEGTLLLPLSRLTTYLTQPDYPTPLTSDLSSIPDPARRYLVYLDAWQRHITTLEDPDLQEVALGSIDTTTRLKTVWQVKLLDVGLATAPVTQEQSFPQFNSLSQPRQVFLTTRLRSTPEAPAGETNQLINALYRVEIHRGGTLEEARFKWSRDNGTVVSAVDRILPQNNVIQVQTSESDSERSFKPGQWVELLTEARELRSQPGILLRLSDVRPGGKLIYDPATVSETINEAIARTEFASTNRPKLRAWDWTENTQGLPLKSPDPSGFIELERNIQVQFSTDLNARYQTGDYWLVPSRSSSRIEWPSDAEGSPLRQRPAGIQHSCSRLALTILTGDLTQPNFEDPGDNGDLRNIFPSLVDCLDGRESFFSGTVGIGVRKPEARLHVRGAATLEGRGRISGEAQSTTINGAETRFTQQLSPGLTLTTVDEQGNTVEIAIASIINDTLLTLTSPLTTALVGATFTYPPSSSIIRFDTKDSQPQFVLDDQGNMAIGTLVPGAKLEVRSTAMNPDFSAFHVKTGGGDGTTLLQVQTNGRVGIGIDKPQANLDVKGIARVSTSTALAAAFLQIQPQEGSAVRFTSNAGHSFDRNLSVTSGTAANTGFLRIQPQDSGPVNFTSNAGYNFDKEVRVAGGSLTVMNGAVENISLNSGGIGMTKGNMILTEGNIEIRNGVLKIGDFQIDKDGVEATDTRFNQITIRDGITFGRPTAAFRISTNPPHFNQPITFAKRITLQSEGLAVTNGGVTIGNGGLTVSDDGANITGNSRMTLRRSGGVTERLTLATISSPTETIPFIIDLPARRLSIRDGATRLVTLALAEGTTRLRFNVVGDAVVGSDYVDQPEMSLENGLLVQGHVGVGLFSNPLVGNNRLRAKLEVRGVTNDATDAALNVTNQSRQSLLYVRNDGQVAIATLDTTPPLGDALPAEAADPATKLFVSGNTVVNGKLFAQKLTGAGIEQVSTRTQKQDIAALSSQEASDLLRSLNPVKYSYTNVDDDSLHAGFIAEDSPNLVTSTDGQAIRVLDVVAVLTRTVKDQREAIVLLNRIVKQQQVAIEALTKKIGSPIS